MVDVRERLFVKEYVINKGNAYRAALKAGYSKRTAQNAYEWLQKTLSNPSAKRHLPYKPYLQQAIESELEKIESAKIADEKEVMQYLTSVMRKESRSQVVVVEGTGDGRSEARLIVKPPDERDSIKAAELIGKVHGMFTDRMDLNADADLNIRIDYGDESDS